MQTSLLALTLATLVTPTAFGQTGDLALILEGRITQSLAPVVGPLSSASVGDQFAARFVVARTPTSLNPALNAYAYQFQRGSLTIEGESAGFDTSAFTTIFWVANDKAQLGDAIDGYVGLAQSDFDVQFALRDPSEQMLDTNSLADLLGPVKISPAGNLSQILLRDANQDATTIGHIFRAEVVDLSTQVGEGECVAAMNSTGASATIEALGSDVLMNNALSLRGRRLPLFSTGLFIASRQADYVVMPGGSLGNLCLGGSIGRFANAVGSSGSTGVLDLDVDLTAIPQPMGTVAGFPGDTWYFQLWFRDTAGGAAVSNFSDRVRVRLL